MRSCLIRCLIGIIAVSSFVSCSKELSREEGNAPAASSFYATLEGNLWNADSLQMLIQVNGGININGLSKTGDQISIVLPTLSTGVFTLGPNTIPIAFYTNILAPIEGDYFSSIGTAGGTVTITSIDTINHLISGTFSLTLVNPDKNTSVTITSGVLNSVPYIVNGVVNPPPANSTDTLKAIVGGNTFDAAQVIVQSTSGQIVISGISNNGMQNLELSMPETTTPGTYDLDFVSGDYKAVYYTDVSNPLIANANGSVVIISNNTTTKTIKGTFSFTASSLDNSTSLEVTSGFFNVKY